MVDAVSGTTRLFMTVADPVHHLRTPSAFNDLFAARGVEAVMIAAQVPRGDLRRFVDGLRGLRELDGLIVTIRYKHAIASLCDELGSTARRVGAVNAVKISGGRLIGENFDRIGFVEDLKRQGYDVRDKRVLILGSGGAAAAIAFALADAGAPVLAIWNRPLAKVELDAMGRFIGAF